MRTRVFLIACLMLPVGVVNAGAAETDQAVPMDLIDLDDAECNSSDTFYAEKTETPLLGNYTTRVDFDIHVLMVEVNEDAARRIMKHVSDLYETLGINVRATYAPAALTINPLPNSSATSPVLSTSESQAYLDASKAHVGGVRPSDADAVYTMVGRNIEGGVAGQADCVGGIAYPESAFAVGEAEWDSEFNEVLSGRIAAHELAHLLAAHHHFANCPQSNVDELVQYQRACTIMFPQAPLISLSFSTLEAAVVRRWALDYLGPDAPAPSPEPTPEPEPSPEPDPQPEPQPRGIERDITFGVNTRGIGGGTVTSDEPDSDVCTMGVPVLLQRRNDSGKWRTVEKATSGPAFRFRIDRAGVYRAKAVEVELEESICLKAISARVRVR